MSDGFAIAMPANSSSPSDSGKASHQPQSTVYGAQMLRGHDPDRWYALRYLADEYRALLTAFYAWHLEIQQIPKAVTAAPLGEIRLQWWRDAWAEIALAMRSPDKDRKPSVRAHPVVEFLHVQLTDYIDTLSHKPVFTEQSGDWRGKILDAIGQTLMEAIEARGRLFYPEAAFETIADLNQWLLTAEGTMDQLAIWLIRLDNFSDKIEAERYLSVPPIAPVPSIVPVPYMPNEEDKDPMLMLAAQLRALTLLSSVCASDQQQFLPKSMTASLDRTEIRHYVKTSFRTLRDCNPSVGKIIPAAAFPVLLPAALVPAKIKEKCTPGSLQVRRHVTYLRAMIFGRL